MTKEEWAVSNCAQSMLKMLNLEQPGYLATQVPQLHKYFIACCWKHKSLIPQKHLRNGLRGAERWIAGEITTDELNELNRHAETEAFAINYAKTSDEIDELNTLIEGIEEIREMSFAQARRLLLDAAYFAEVSMIYPRMRSLPWVDSLFTSRFLCPELLRDFIMPYVEDRS